MSRNKKFRRLSPSFRPRRSIVLHDPSYVQVVRFDRDVLLAAAVVAAMNIDAAHKAKDEEKK